MGTVTVMVSDNMDPNQALDSAKALDLKQVLVLGYLEDGTMCIRSSKMARKDVLWILESAKLAQWDLI